MQLKEAQAFLDLNHPQSLLHIRDNIIDMLNPHRHTHDIRSGACLNQFRFRQLAMRGRGRVDNQRPCVADIGEVAE